MLVTLNPNVTKKYLLVGSKYELRILPPAPRPHPSLFAEQVHLVSAGSHINKELKEFHLPDGCRQPSMLYRLVWYGISFNSTMCFIYLRFRILFLAALGHLDANVFDMANFAPEAKLYVGLMYLDAPILIGITENGGGVSL